MIKIFYCPSRGLGEKPSTLVGLRHGTLSPVKPYVLRSEVLFGLDHQIPQAHIDRANCNMVTETDLRDIQIQTCRNIERAYILGSCPYICIRSAASLCEQLTQVEGDDLQSAFSRKPKLPALAGM